MTLISGRRVLIGIGKESTRGTAVAATYWLPTTEHNLKPGIEHVRDESARGRIEGVSGSDVARKFSEPSFTGNIREKSFPLLMLAALGSVSTAANSPESGVYTHSFSVLNSNEHPSLSIISADATVIQRTALSMIRSLAITAVTDQFAQFTAEFDAKSPATTTASPAIVSESLFTPKKVTVKMADTPDGLDAATKLSILSCSLTIEKGTTRHHAVGEVEPDAITNGTLTVSGEMEIRFEDTTYQTYLLSGAKKAFRLTLEDTDTTIGTTSHPVIEFELAHVAFESYERSEGNDDVMTQTVGFIAEFSIADGKMISAKAVNTVTSY